MSTLAEQISNLTNPVPVFEDPEDIDDDTGAKLISTRAPQDEDDDFDRSTPSKLRSKASALLPEYDPKYAGKKTSRERRDKDTLLHEIEGSSDDDAEDTDEGMSDPDSEDVSDEESGDEEAGNDVIKSDEEDEQLEGFKEKLKFQDASPATSKSFTFKHDGDFSQYGEDDESEEGSDEDEDSEAGSDEEDTDDDYDDDDDDSGSEEESGEDEEDMEQDGVQQFTKVNVEDEIQKGKAVKAQLGIWDSMLEGRIKLQKALIAANQLPNPDSWDDFVEEGGSELQKELQQSQVFLQKLLEQLVSLQTTLMVQNPETRALLDPKSEKQQANNNKKGSQKGKLDDDDDEEITSESEVDSENENSQSEALKSSKQLLKRKLKMAEYPEFLAKRHADFQPYRNSTIQKWYDKTRVSSGKLHKGFSAFEQSALKQIEQILSDKDRLIKRTQLKRSSYKIVGQLPAKTEEVKEDDDIDLDKEAMLSRVNPKDYNEEIFDDDDFYHQLLRELIERKTSDINDPMALSRQWLEIQRLRSKTKKTVDTKASKGRKIRYNIHSKLVNFMAPADQSSWTDEARDELFKSLFGRNAAADTTEQSDR